MRLHYVIPLVIGVLVVVDALIGDGQNQGALTDLHARAGQQHADRSSRTENRDAPPRQAVALSRTNVWGFTPHSDQANGPEIEIADFDQDGDGQSAQLQSGTRFRSVAATKLTVAGSAVSSPVLELIER